MRIGDPTGDRFACRGMRECCERIVQYSRMYNEEACCLMKRKMRRKEAWVTTTMQEMQGLSKDFPEGFSKGSLKCSPKDFRRRCPRAIRLRVKI